MKLYTNGCSYVAGHADIDYTQINNQDWPLPWHSRTTFVVEIAKHFEQDFNHAWPGGSTYRMLRTVTHFVSTIDPSEYKDYIFVLLFTHLGRIETISNEDAIPVKIEPDKIDVNYDHSYMPHIWDQHSTLNDEDKQRCLDFQKGYLLGHCRRSMFMDYLSHIQCITSLLDLKGIKYLYATIDPIDEFNDVVFEGLQKCINTENKVEHIMRPEWWLEIDKPSDDPGAYLDRTGWTDPCGHPSKYIHGEYAKYIITELKNRNWL